MRIRNVDPITNDWQMGHGLQDYAVDANAVSINVKTRLQEWLNDCYFAMDRGIDWLNRMGLTNQQKLLDQDIRRIILQTDGVTRINSLIFTVTNRNFTATYNIDTQYSQNFTDIISKTY